MASPEESQIEELRQAELLRIKKHRGDCYQQLKAVSPERLAEMTSTIVTHPRDSSLDQPFVCSDGSVIPLDSIHHPKNRAAFFRERLSVPSERLKEVRAMIVTKASQNASELL
jgi:hypothetical protein